MPMKVNPDIIRYYQERIKDLQNKINSLWNYVRELDNFAASTLNRNIPQQFAASQMNVIRKMQSDTKAEMRRIGQAIENYKAKVEQWTHSR